MAPGLSPAASDARIRFTFPSGIWAISLTGPVRAAARLGDIGRLRDCISAVTAAYNLRNSTSSRYLSDPERSLGSVTRGVVSGGGKRQSLPPIGLHRETVTGSGAEGNHIIPGVDQPTLRRITSSVRRSNGSFRSVGRLASVRPTTRPALLSMPTWPTGARALPGLISCTKRPAQSGGLRPLYSGASERSSISGSQPSRQTTVLRRTLFCKEPSLILLNVSCNFVGSARYTRSPLPKIAHHLRSISCTHDIFGTWAISRNNCLTLDMGEPPGEFFTPGRLRKKSPTF
jgi:hypothetical protein